MSRHAGKTPSKIDFHPGNGPNFANPEPNSVKLVFTTSVPDLSGLPASGTILNTCVEIYIQA
jgi:hypothetical protein